MAKRSYYNLRQTLVMSCQEYFERVRNIVDVIKSLGGSLCDDMHLVDELPDQARHTAEQMREARAQIINKKVAYGVLVRADRNRYGKLIEEIENDCLMGNNNHPKTPTEAYNLLVNYKNYAANANKKNVPGGLDQVAFLIKRGRNDDGEEDTGERPKKDRSKLMCFNCLQYGHYKSECKNPDPRKNGGLPVVTATTLMTYTDGNN
jgi:hypothetical protein